MSHIEPMAPALDSARESLRQYRRAGLVWLIGGLALLVMVGLLAKSMEDRAISLAKSGLHSPGTVLSTDGGGLHLVGSIVVRFTIGEVEHIATINLDSNSPRYRVGDSVDVIYDPRDLSEVRTSKEQNDPGWGVLAFVVGVNVGLLWAFTGWVIRRRSRRWRKVLAVEPWREAKAAYADLGRGRSLVRLTRLTIGRRTVVRRITNTTPQRLRCLRSTSTVWIAGPLEGPMIVAPTINGPLFEVRPARGRSSQYAWEKSFPSPPPE